jgi:hypothetical protein
MKVYWKPSNLHFFLILVFSSTSNNQIYPFYNPISNVTTAAFRADGDWKIKQIKDYTSSPFSSSFPKIFPVRSPAILARKKLAEIAGHWADLAHSITQSKYSEVIYLTRKTQEATLQSLSHAATAAFLQDALAKATRISISARDRYFSYILSNF